MQNTRTVFFFYSVTVSYDLYQNKFNYASAKSLHIFEHEFSMGNCIVKCTSVARK